MRIYIFQGDNLTNAVFTPFTRLHTHMSA